MRYEFGQLAGYVRDELQAADRFLEDPMTAAVGGQEVVGIVTRASQERLRTVLDSAGITPEEFDRELRERTSPRFAFDFGSVVDYLGANGPAQSYRIRRPRL